ncbi:MAG TPA: hypothetical protein VF463_08410 [Sphingobium sp.]
MAVDAITAEWLRSTGSIATADDAAVKAAWGDLASVSEITSPLALATDANVEARRQLEFMNVPLAIEKVEVAGDHSSSLGRLLTIVAAGGGYADGIKVFVIAVEPASSARRSILTVLRRLA